MQVIAAIQEALSELSLRGTSLIASDYESWAVFPKGAWVEWNTGTANEKRYGVVEGLGELSELVVKTHDGETLRLYAEDIKLRAAQIAGGGSLL
jgi:hypothetical protein